MYLRRVMLERSGGHKWKETDTTKHLLCTMLCLFHPFPCQAFLHCIMVASSCALYR